MWSRKKYIIQTEIGLSVTALDLSDSELAKKRAPKKFILDNTNLPFSSNSFDIVISDGVIHHITLIF